MRTALALSCLLLLLPCAWSCGKLRPNPGFTWSTNPPTDTAATNAVRQQLGLRQINTATWTFYGRKTFPDGHREETWSLPGELGLAKYVEYAPDGSIRCESDTYYTGRTYLPPSADGGTTDEHLYLAYDYATGRASLDYRGPDARVQALFGQSPNPEGVSSEPGQRSLDAVQALADNVLALWGMQRL